MIESTLIPRFLTYISVYGFLAIAIFAFLESSMIFPYLPAEVVVPLAATELVTGFQSLFVFVAMTTVGGTLGALFLYRLSNEGWEQLGSRLHQFTRVSSDHRARASEWFRRWGEPSVMWGRLLPGLRSLISIPAGMSRMDSQKFIAYTTFGTMGFYLLIGCLVLFIEQWQGYTGLMRVFLNSPIISTIATGFTILLLLFGWAITKHSLTRYENP